MLNPLFSTKIFIGSIILALAISPVLLLMIDKLPNYIYKTCQLDSQKILNLPPIKLVTVDTKIQKPLFFVLTLWIGYLIAATTAFSFAQFIADITFTSIILTLIIIDYKTMLLPDQLTIPLLWIGLLFNLHGLTSDGLDSSVYGAIAGYLSLYLTFWGYKLLTRKNGMGYGDFKLLAAILAFLGIKYLIPMLILSSCLGIVYYLYMSLRNKFSASSIDFANDGIIPFGPFLGSAGLIFFFWGSNILHFFIVA